MAITFNPPSHNCLFNKHTCPYAVRTIENDILGYSQINSKTFLKFSASLESIKETSTLKFGNKTLHYILETYLGYYDTESVLSRCLKTRNFQAASKIAILNDHYGDSLGFQLTAFENYIDTQNLDFTTFNECLKQNSNNISETNNTIIDSNKQMDFYKSNTQSDLKHSNSGEKNYFLSGSSSLDSIQQWNDDMEDQGGRESPCNISEDCDIRQSMSYYLQSIKKDGSPTISSVSSFISQSPYKILRHRMNDGANIVMQIKDMKTRKTVQLASCIVEFYIKQTYSSENHILMQNILLKCIEFWLLHNLPVPILENILLKNMDKYFYPLSILLFCKNFNNNLEDEIVEKDEEGQQQEPSGFLKEFSTKFCLQLCSMVLENVDKV